MGNGVQPVNSYAPRPLGQEEVQEIERVRESRNLEVNQDNSKSTEQDSLRPASSPYGRKLEQSLNGAARRAELEFQFDREIERGESMKAARRILDDPRLSNDSKISRLQKMIENSNPLEFEQFMAQLKHFSSSQRELVNSAISESPRIMERVADELPAGTQLSIVSDAILHPMKGKTEKDERKRQERADKGFGEWMQRTDTGTLNVALEGRGIDFRASAKLFGVLASDGNRLIQSIGGHNQSRLLGDNLTIATELMNLVYGPASQRQGPLTRSEIEDVAGSLIIRNAQINNHIGRR